MTKADSIMDFQRYDSIDSFRADVLPVLLENEVQNNLLLGLIDEDRSHNTEDWLLATVTDRAGEIKLTAICAKPFGIMLYETGNNRCNAALSLLTGEIRRLGYTPSGVMARCGLGQRFCESSSTVDIITQHRVIVAMQLDRLNNHENVSGRCRTLENCDMFFAPYWERAFSEECRSTVFSISDNVKRIRKRLGMNSHFIWEDGVPVSQAVHGRDTPNGAVINLVYTPPHYRGRGYATAIVAALSGSLLERGRSFCCLFAEADNPISRGIYNKLGYHDVCELEDIRFRLRVK